MTAPTEAPGAGLGDRATAVSVWRTSRTGSTLHPAVHFEYPAAAAVQLRAQRGYFPGISVDREAFLPDSCGAPVQGGGDAGGVVKDEGDRGKKRG